MIDYTLVERCDTQNAAGVASGAIFVEGNVTDGLTEYCARLREQFYVINALDGAKNALNVSDLLQLQDVATRVPGIGIQAFEFT